jgi:hypothetical protein
MTAVLSGSMGGQTAPTLLSRLALSTGGDAFQHLDGNRLHRDGIGNQPVHPDPGIGIDRDAKRGEREMLDVGRECAATSGIAPG